MARTAEPAFDVMNATGTGPAVMVCEHASNHIPARYHGLGLDAAARASHAAWDPGAEAAARLLSKALDAPLIAGRVSRLVYDCNRPPDAPSAMPAQSETIAIPANAALSDDDRAERVRTVYAPFTQAVSDLIEQRKAQGTPFALITMHSFTPLWFGTPRPVEIGVLHDDDSRLADSMLAEAHRLSHRRIARNAPYGPADGVTHTLRLHGLQNDLPNVMIELRNDLLTTPADERAMAQELATLLRPALAHLGLQEQSDA